MIAQIVASAIGTVLGAAAIVVALETRSVLRWRKRLPVHTTVLTELNQAPPGQPRPWQVTCAHAKCAGKASTHPLYGAASVWARGHEDNPVLFVFPPMPPTAAQHKKGMVRNGSVD